MSTEPDFRGWKLKNDRVWVWEAEETVILGFGLSWKSQDARQILESSGELPSGEGMKSDREQGKSGEWMEQVQQPELDWSMKCVSVIQRSYTEKTVFLCVCPAWRNLPDRRRFVVLFNMKAHRADMSPGAIRSQSPVLVLSRWETLTWDDLRVAAIVWVWEQTSLFYLS